MGEGRARVLSPRRGGGGVRGHGRGGAGCQRRPPGTTENDGGPAGSRTVYWLR
ncbi:hypothetical protein J2S47_001681 [Streptomyces griseoviridis]|jgi:hypothetical protein|uniref:Uncharacterized protein n=1 Tax=Streptomyces griseoviridis TaxID=45398 RepID=A0ABT9LBS9_STRGD|nr:hypothetical protein [Streptomyces griseoviridis]